MTTSPVDLSSPALLATVQSEAVSMTTAASPFTETQGLDRDHAPATAVEYQLPASPEGAATPPARTLVMQFGGASAAAAAAAPPPLVQEPQHQQRSRHRGSASAPSKPPLGSADGNRPDAPRQQHSPTTSAQVVTLQPCKIVYHYPDHTVQTYVLVQEASAATTPCPSPQPLMQTASGTRADAPHVPLCRCLASPPHGPPSPFTCSSCCGGGGEVNDSDGVRRGLAVHLKPLPHTDTPATSTEISGDTSHAVTAASALQMTPMCPTCGAGACLPDAYRPPEYVSDISPSNPRIGSPGPMTLFAFGFTTCLYNVHQAGICPMNLTTMGLICFYGGLSQFVGGFFELVNKNTIFCTLDVTYGAFWMATAIANLVPPNTNVVAEVTSDYMGGFFMLWFFFAATMFASSMKFSYVQMLLNFSVTLNFFLNFLGNFTQSKALVLAAGYEGIVEGCLATYVGMALTMRDIYGRNILPLFFQKNFRVTEW